MALTRELIVGTAMGILREYGLGDLTMRRLARDLGVQPGALYWHVKNKQELLIILARMILEPASTEAEADIRSLALHVRSALLAVRDGAEVAALAHALTPETLSPLLRFATLLEAGGLEPQEAEWAAETLVHYILGTVAQEQTRAGFISAGILAGGVADTQASFNFGLDIFLAGLP